MIVKRFEEQVTKTPHRTAIKLGEESLTYEALNRYANRVAHLISGTLKQTGTAERVSLLFDHGPHMIAAILGVLKAGKTYVPLSPDYPEQRLSFMISHSAVSLVVSDSRNMEHARKLAVKNRIMALNSEELTNSGSIENPGIVPCDEGLMYILYTSGSTGRPKGVMQILRNVIHFIDQYKKNLQITANDRMTLLSSFSHDAAIMDIYTALLNGAALYPLDVKNQIEVASLPQWLEKEEITIWHSVPTIYRYFVNLLNGVPRLPYLRFIVLGGEAVIKNDVDMFQKYFPRAVLYNLYGQTESSYNSGEFITAQQQIGHITLGKAVDKTEIFVIDENDMEVDEYEVGEIMIACPHVSPGYWKDEETTEQVFSRDEEVSNLYFTGDLGRLLPGGKIEFMGRKDSQVKLRGFRIELGEIESQLLRYPEIGEAVAAVKEIAAAGVGVGSRGDKYLCAYIVPKSPDSQQPLDIPALKAFLSKELPDYMIPTYFVTLDRLPSTQSGKIDRNALPEPEIGGRKPYVAPRDQVEEKLVEIWQEVLGVEKEKIGIDSDFFELGGHSLRGTTMLSKVHKEFNVQIPVAKIFQIPTICGLAKYIKEAVRDKYIPIEPTEKKSYYALSFNQKRLWFIHQRDPLSPAYNMPHIIDLPHHVDCGTLKKALLELIQRHECLRTGFKIATDEPVQFILPRLEKLSFREIDISKLDELEKEKKWEQVFKDESRRAFDLVHAPLARFVLVKLAEDNYKFIYIVHHIISDGWSMELFKRELLYIYESHRGGKSIKLEPIKVQYKDFSEWHTRQVAEGVASRKSHRFWKEKLRQGIPQLVLPRRISGDSRDIRGAMYRFMIPGELKKWLKNLAQTHNTSLFMVMFTAYIIALSRYSNQKDIACSIINAGREHEALHPIIGFFVNSVIFITRVDGEENFTKFLQRIHTDVLECFQHQNYPLEKVFEEMMMRYPDIPVAFNMVNLHGTVGSGGNFRGKNGILADSRTGSREMESFNPYHITNTHDDKFDLESYVIEYNNGIDTLWAYKKSIFKAAAIESFVKDYIRLLEFFIGNPHKSYRDFKASGEKRRFNRM